jgi:hypothetical protein
MTSRAWDILGVGLALTLASAAWTHGGTRHTAACAILGAICGIIGLFAVGAVVGRALR